MDEQINEPIESTGTPAEASAEEPPRKLDRRSMLTIAGAVATAAWATRRFPKPIEFKGDKSSVAIIRAKSYSTELVQPLLKGLRACNLDVKGKRVLLKPNLVEFDKATAINTDVAMVAAALEAFRQLGAAEVRIGEGPGHRRDTWELAGQAHYRKEIPDFDNLFVDLNRDDVAPVEGFSATEPKVYFSKSLLQSDLIVSLAKMKTHHWAGATLSMKNFFGLMPGSIYGWPKNMLHQYGIPQSIVELNRIFPNSFAIVDGIVGMEGNGPIQGTPKPCGVMVMGRDVRAVDATCCRIMDINPTLVEYLELAGALGNWAEDRIEQRGETIASVKTPFKLLGMHQHLRLS